MAIYENEIIVEDVDGVDNNKVEAECLYMEVGSVRLVRLFFVLLLFLIKVQWNHVSIVHHTTWMQNGKMALSRETFSLQISVFS